jgi:hypothetical protein
MTNPNNYPHSVAGLLALAAETGVSLRTLLDVQKFNPRSWLVEQGLLDEDAAEKLSDGAICFFAAGAMTERQRAKAEAGQ